MYDEDAEPFQIPFGLGEIDYTQYTNKQLVAVPLAVLLISLTILAASTVITGAPVDRDIDFVGGTELRIETTDSQAEIEAAFEQEVAEIRPIRGEGDVYVVSFTSDDTAAIEDQAEAAGYEVTQIQTRSPTFGASTQVQAIYGVGLAFVGMSAIVFLVFRTFVPSIAVVASAFSDMMIPLAMMSLLDIQLSLGTVAALLMLIGYSVDSDILFNNHVLRRRGGFYESAYSAMRTGITMNLTSIVAMTVMTIVAWFFGIPLLPEIGVVLVIGLVADLMNTYMLNFSLLRWYKYEGVNR